MSGRWVWCPDGWWVVPEVPTNEMRSAAGQTEEEYEDLPWEIFWERARDAMRAAPEPPSGWQPMETAEFDDSWRLAWAEAHGRMYTWDFDHDCDAVWMRQNGLTHWTPLPPPPEVKP